MSIGFALPFSKSTGSLGFFESTDEETEAVKQNLKSLLLTNWGERVIHYQFGCNLKQFLFENLSSDELKSQIADRIISQVDQWLPFVTIDKLNILFNEDDSTIPEHAISLRIEFRLSGKQDTTSKLDLVVIGSQ